jgi:hypothetical protein
VLALLTDFNLSLLRHRFSCGGGRLEQQAEQKQGEVMVTAYEFAEFTDDYGLVKALQRLLDPAALEVQPSTGKGVYRDEGWW